MRELVIIWLFIFGMGVSIWLVSRKMGKSYTKNLLHGGIAGGLGAILIQLFSLLPDSWEDRAHLGLFLLALVMLGGYTIVWPQRRKQSGSVLMAVGSIHSTSSIFASVTFALFGITLPLITISEGKNFFSLIIMISAGLCFLSLAAFVLFSGLSKLEIRENGILKFPSFIKWKEIISYQWEGRTGNILTVRRKARWSKTISWPISPVHKDGVNRLLVHHLSGGTTKVGGS
ncbi:hypothetical protein HYR99_19795 [Candidatus Poribacteria bacterium]|nr:hypothetical protein [Candidatus Poribacteria bacterium]